MRHEFTQDATLRLGSLADVGAGLDMYLRARRGTDT